MRPALNTDVQKDLVTAVKSIGGHIMIAEGWDYVAISDQPFTSEDANKALVTQVRLEGEVPETREWKEPDFLLVNL